MTTVYIPQLIKSAEQAEALPEGTVARHDEHMPVERWETSDGTWIWGYLDAPVLSEDLVGWTALVPIEAEEERDDEWASYGGVNRRRLVTPWEEQS